MTKVDRVPREFWIKKGKYHTAEEYEEFYSSVSTKPFKTGIHVREVLPDEHPIFTVDVQTLIEIDSLKSQLAAAVEREEKLVKVLHRTRLAIWCENVDEQSSAYEESGHLIAEHAKAKEK